MRSKGPQTQGVYIRKQRRVHYVVVRRRSHVLEPIAHCSPTPQDVPSLLIKPGRRYRSPGPCHQEQSAQGLLRCDRLHPTCRQRKNLRVLVEDISVPPPALPAHVVFAWFVYSYVYHLLEGNSGTLSI